MKMMDAYRQAQRAASDAREARDKLKTALHLAERAVTQAEATEAEVFKLTKAEYEAEHGPKLRAGNTEPAFPKDGAR